MQHHFSIEIAQLHGVNEAIFLENIAFWIWHNKANGKHFYENRYWTYNSQKSFSELFPYWSRQNLRTIIKSCTKQDLIIKGSFNKSNYDHTQWYSLTDKGLKLFNRLSDIGCNQPADMSESTNRSECGLQGIKVVQDLNNTEWLESTHQVVEPHQPIPYINTDNKQKIKDKIKAQPAFQVAVVIDLPSWLDKQTWEDFKQHRKEMKKPMSELAQRKTINQLDKMRSKGQNVEDVLNQSIANGWQGVFEIKQFKEKVNGTTNVVNGKNGLECEQRNWNSIQWDILKEGCGLSRDADLSQIKGLIPGEVLDDLPDPRRDLDPSAYLADSLERHLERDY